MSLIWFASIVFVVMNDGINAGVVVRRRPISIQERIPYTTTQATTTTTASAPEESMEINHRLSRLTLPSNATSIRSDITDNFSCAGRPYGYYADVENDCQIFHVCLPSVMYGQERQFRWSFICPEETTFNQEAFTCVRTDEMNFDCIDSEKFYELNRILGIKEETSTEEIISNELIPIPLGENTKSKPGETHNETPNKDYNDQRFKPIINNPIRIATQSVTVRSQIPKKTTINVLTSPVNTERSPQTTNFREFSSTADRNSLLTTTTTTNDLIPSTLFPPINIAQFFDSTTRKAFNYPTTTLKTDFTTDFEQTTRTNFVPDLYENNEQSKADEVVESIKQLQKLFPSSSDDSREKRVLMKSDSVKNRQKLFEMLNHH